MGRKTKSQNYIRILRYVKPYKAKLAVGILAGFVAGGSLFGSFFWIKDLIEPFEKRPAAPGVELAVADRKPESPAQTEDTVKKSGKEAEKKLKEFQFLEKYANEYGIPLQTPDGRLTWQGFALAISGLILLFFLKNLATYLNKYYTRWVGTRVIADFRDEIFGKLLNQSLKFYGNTDVGQLISRSTNDTSQMESAVAHTIADATRCPIEIAACLGFLIYTAVTNRNMSLLLTILIGLPAAVLPIIILGRKIRKTYKRAYSKIADVVTIMHEVFTGILVVKAYGMEEAENARFKETNRKYFKTLVRALKLELAMTPLMEFVAVLSVIAFWILCYAKELTISQIFVLVAPAIMAYRPLKDLAKINTYIQKSMAAADRYFELVDMQTEVTEKPGAVPIERFERDIRFDNVSFSYGDRKILDNFNLVIPAGKVVAVVGETGSGKTTIANLIARFYDVDAGSVKIDGRDVRDMKISSIRSLIGIVSQQSILFNDTIANNIAYGQKNPSRDQIEEAAKKANAYQFIVDGRHGDGFDTVVGEKGFKLSGGERQRISIARAILKNPPILILDEATSSLDTVTEKLVQDALDNAMSGRTVFAIAHRLSTIQHADTIIVLAGGGIAESGTHEELLARGGQYKRLFEMQFSKGARNSETPTA